MAKTKTPKQPAAKAATPNTRKGKARTAAKVPKGTDSQPAQAAAAQLPSVAPAPEPPAEFQPQTTRAAKAVGPKKVSALDAAARVLAEAGAAMSTQALIEAMAAKGYWTSPGGQTPAATLYSVILRETTTKGEHSRFVKTERGKFALKANQ